MKATKIEDRRNAIWIAAKIARTAIQKARPDDEWECFTLVSKIEDWVEGIEGEDADAVAIEDAANKILCKVNHDISLAQWACVHLAYAVKYAEGSSSPKEFERVIGLVCRFAKAALTSEMESMIQMIYDPMPNDSSKKRLGNSQTRAQGKRSNKQNKKLAIA